MHVIFCDCTEFRNEILLRGEECNTRENSDFLKNGKMVISIKIQNFSRSRMMKRTLLLEFSRDI